MSTAIHARDHASETPATGARGGVRDPEVLLVLGLTILAAALRFATIGGQSYWIDESITVHEMHLSFGALLHSVRVNETTPPLYFVLAWIWAKLFGTGEIGLRSLSALAGTALVPVAYLAARELVSRRAGQLAALFAAVSPFLIWYSQEARSYMLFGLFCGLSVLFWARARREPSRRNLALWAAASVLAVLTHFFAGFLVAPEAVWLLYVARSRRVFAACAAIAVAQLAVLPLVIGDTGHPLGWIQAFPLSIRLQQVPVDLGLSTLYQTSLVTDAALGSALLAAIVVATLAVGGTVREHRGAAAAALLALLAIGLPMLLAAFGRDYVVPRNFMPAWLPLAIVIAAAASAPRARVLGVLLALLVVGGSVYALVRIAGDSDLQRPNWRGVAAALGPQHGTRAILAYAGTYATEPMSVYLPGTGWSWTGIPASSAPVTLSEIDVVGNQFQAPVAHRPAGVRLIAARAVDGYVVDRFALSPARALTPSAAAALGDGLLTGGSGGAVLIQR